MSHRKIAITRGIRICHNTKSSIFYNPRTFERLEVESNAGSLVRLLQGGEKTPSDILECFAEQHHVEKEHLGTLSDRLNKFIDKLVEKDFLSWKL